MWAISESDPGQISPIIWTPPYNCTLNQNKSNLPIIMYTSLELLGYGHLRAMSFMFSNVKNMSVPIFTDIPSSPIERQFQKIFRPKYRTLPPPKSTNTLMF